MNQEEIQQHLEKKINSKLDIIKRNHEGPIYLHNACRVVDMAISSSRHNQAMPESTST